MMVCIYPQRENTLQGYGTEILHVFVHRATSIEQPASSTYLLINLPPPGNVASSRTPRNPPPLPSGTYIIVVANQLIESYGEYKAPTVADTPSHIGFTIPHSLVHL